MKNAPCCGSCRCVLREPKQTPTIQITARSRLVILWPMVKKQDAGGSFWSCNPLLQVVMVT